MRSIASIVSVIAAVLAAAPALAQKRTAAEAAFREGRELMEQERFAEACAKFVLSQRLEPGVGTLLNLGACHEKQGKLATAWTHYNEAADSASRSGDHPRGEKIRALAEALEEKLSRLEIRAGKEPPEGLRVERDGEDVTALLGAAVPVDPGEYAIEATADGFHAWSKEVAVEGEGITVEVDIPPLSPLPKEEPEEVAPPDTQPDPDPSVQLDLTSSTPSDPGRVRRLAGIGLVAGGAASTALGLYFGWRAMDKNDAYKKECPGGVCPDADSRGFDLESSARKNANLANVFVGLGLVAAAGGTYLWLTAPAPRAGSETKRGPIAAPLLSPEIAGAAVSATF